MTLLSMTFSLFLLMDSIGNLPLFIAILKDIPRKRQLQIIFREMIIALLIMVAFQFVGESVLYALQIQQYAVLVSGGIILFLLSLRMIFPSAHDADANVKKDKEPFIVPLAIPLVAGPAVLALIMLYSRQQPEPYITITAIVLAWVLTTAILLSSAFLNKILGKRGIIACERLMGLILTMMSVQMFLQGIAQFTEAQ
ncbi:MAG: MarC family protein [Rhabdochlamydiaceae bacterium]|jgi:multiple antibiotic resistance protein